jgi:hypothetical protein
MLFLKTVNKDGKSWGGTFQWKKKVGSVVECPDWKPTDYCGNGLHGLKDGVGSGSLLFNPLHSKTRWIIFSARKSIDLNWKHKVKRAKIEYFGDRRGACKFLLDKGRSPENIPYLYVETKKSIFSRGTRAIILCSVEKPITITALGSYSFVRCSRTVKRIDVDSSSSVVCANNTEVRLGDYCDAIVGDNCVLYSSAYNNIKCGKGCTIIYPDGRRSVLERGTYRNHAEGFSSRFFKDPCFTLRVGKNKTVRVERKLKNDF